MHSAISATLGAIHFADPQFVGGLTVLPIIVDTPEHVDILSLSQAHESGAVTIRELQGHASVPELEVINAGNLPVLILDGEQVRGGWQDRAAAVSCLLGPRSELRLPVSCVEHGR